ncbi:Thymidylate kinase [Marinomonas gallaica]|uniref:Thymidylate kinase n=1 Tax=Marinomonas gallaica TaxID=1806667 RepID=A0A1C3JUU1_9GAMM|nr:dTMP kinase [Marinomonas gallaica]SBT18826.1 Thymidylate kinase [Marinomonas gallaica]SBT21781.1 Thymidylate kinase [Marinomonas gallaica]
MNAQFISLEGGEGAGKSSAIQCIEAWLTEHEIPYILTREPGGTPMAEEIRELVLSARDEQVAPNTELLLVFASRVQHLNEKIQPALAQGKWVISDRFVDSSYVYQGVARGINESVIDNLVDTFLKNQLPNKTLLLDVPVELGLQRVQSRGESNRLDGESLAFHQKVRDGFLHRASQDPERFVVVDASQAIASVEAQIVAQLNALLAGHNA